MFIEEEFENMYNSNIGDGFGDFSGRWRKRLKRIVKAPTKIAKAVIKAPIKIAKTAVKLPMSLAKTAIKLPTKVIRTVSKPVIGLAKMPFKMVKPITRPVVRTLQSVIAPKQTFEEPVSSMLQEAIVPTGPVKTYDAASGQYYDASTGNLFDPNTNQYYDPYTLGKYYDPTTKVYHDTNTGEPIEKPVQEANLWQVMPPDMPQAVLKQAMPEIQATPYYSEPVPAPYYPQFTPQYMQPQPVNRMQDLWYKADSAPSFIQYDESSLPDLPDYSQWRTMPSMESMPVESMYEEEAPMLTFDPETMPEYKDPYESDWWFSGLGEDDVPWYKKVASAAKGIVGTAKDIRSQASEIRRDVKTLLPKKKTEAIAAEPMVEERATSPLLLYGLGAITIAGGAYLLLRKTGRKR